MDHLGGTPIFGNTQVFSSQPKKWKIHWQILRHLESSFGRFLAEAEILFTKKYSWEKTFATFKLTHMLHVWNIYLHLPEIYNLNVDGYSIDGAIWVRYWLSFVRRFDDDRVSRGRAISGVEGDVGI